MKIYIQNAIHRFWANGQNFIEELINEKEITEETTVKELLELIKRKVKEFPLT